MPLASGSRFGPYEILSPLGSGGMGEVYRARDLKLNRDVALKVLPDLVANDPERLARFKREAQVLASLNHPNIGGIYGFEESNGVGALVLELVEGPTLADRIAQGPIPLDEALPIARQIAEALEAAHEHGIIHRDLKPTNIKVRADGSVKVLDFGLAKAKEPAGAMSPSMSQSPTITTPAMTQAGMILGTAAYMSPEQARGTTVDKRSDLWAFGAVLWEMVTGTRLFDGATVSDTLAAVLRAEPDWTALPANAPAPIRRLLRRCLEKDRKRRLDSAAAARLEIEEALTAPSVADAAVARPAAVSKSRVIAVASVALLVGAALTLGVFVSTGRLPVVSSPPVTRLLMGLQPAESILGGPGTNSQARPTRTAIAWSPDGRTLVFGGGRASVEQLYVRRLDQLQATPLAGTEGAVSPFFSPDGGWVGFWAAGALKKVSTSGGPAVTICETPLIGGATWADGDVIFFDALRLDAEGIWRVAAGGGRPERVVMPDRSKGEFSLRLPHALPGGRALLLTKLTNSQLADAKIVAWSLATGQQVVLTEGADARYVLTGHLVFVRQGALLAAPFDVTALRLTGGAVGVVDDVMQAFNAPTAPLSTGAAQFDVSPTGSLAYASGGIFAENLRPLVWVDRAGIVMPLALPQRSYWGPRLAPDGWRLAFYATVNSVVGAGSGARAWISDLRSGTSTPITETGSILMPVWSPDGVRVAFSDAGSLFWRRADGGGGPERLTTSPNSQAPSSWSPDGKVLAFVESNPTSAEDIWVLPIGEGKTPPRPWLNTRFSEQHPDWSPDGRWLAYTSNESGRSEVYVQPYPGPGARYSVSRDGGTSPAWARDGRELFYLAPGPDGQVTMMTVPVTTTLGFSISTPQKLFQGRFFASSLSRSYDVTADGRRFIMVQPPEQAPMPVAQIVVVQNWVEELKRLAPHIR